MHKWAVHAHAQANKSAIFASMTAIVRTVETSE